MLRVVSNTTPIISLLKLGEIDLLEKLYRKINIPLAVYKEIEAGKNKAYYKNLSEINWIKIHEINDKKALDYFSNLDAGEAEAIVLATEIQSDLIIMDEKLGRAHAKHADLKLTGTIGLLIKAKTEGYLKQIKPLLDELTSKNVWISEKLKQKILEKVNEI